MAKDKQPQRPKVDPLAAEIDALLKKLPHADPGLRGDEAPRPVGPVSTGARPDARTAPVRDRKPPSDGRARLAVWGRVLLGVVFGGALTQWPYRTDCGWPLYGYSGVVLLLLIVGAWSALASWRQRIGAAHLVSLVVMFWGFVLAAEVVLPRIGYAVDSATWRCQPSVPASPSQRPAAVPPAASVAPGAVGRDAERTEPGAAATVADSTALTADSALPAADSVQPRPDSIPG